MLFFVIRQLKNGVSKLNGVKMGSKRTMYIRDVQNIMVKVNLAISLTRVKKNST